MRIHRVRKHLGWDIERFNTVLEHLVADYTIELHGGDPSALTAEQIAASYEGERGQVFITLSWRE